MKLTEEYDLDRVVYGFKLKFASSTEVRKRVCGKLMVCRDKSETFYSTLAQGLQGFIRHYYEGGKSIEEVAARAEEAYNIVELAVEAIDKVDKKVMEKYKIVKYSKN